MQKHQTVADKLNIKVQKLNSEEAKQLFPYLDFKEGDEAWFEDKKSGYVNPRQLDKLEQMLAINNGCVYIDDVVLSVKNLSEDNDNSRETRSQIKDEDVTLCNFGNEDNHTTTKTPGKNTGNLIDLENSDVMEVTTMNNGKIYAHKVLLATGAFTEFQDLLPQGIEPDVFISTETVILAEVSEEDQERMRYSILFL